MTHEEQHHTIEDFEHELQEHDEWFRHDASEPHHQKAHGETNGFKIAAFLAVVIVIVFVTAGALLVYFKAAVKSQLEQSEAALTWPELEDSLDQWNDRLTSFGVVDAEADTYHIPLDRAIDLTIQQYSGAPSSVEQ